MAVLDSHDNMQGPDVMSHLSERLLVFLLVSLPTTRESCYGITWKLDSEHLCRTYRPPDLPGKVRSS